MSDPSNSGTRRWFNDRRFTFASGERLRQHISQLVTDLNQVAQQNPALVEQLHQQLNRLSDILNANVQSAGHSGDAAVSNGVELPMASTSTNEPLEANHNGAGADVVLEMWSAGPADHNDSGSDAQPPVTASVDVDNLTEQQQVETVDRAADQIRQSAEWRRVSDLLSSPELQAIVKVVFVVVPFLLLILIKLLLEHSAGLLLLALFTVSFLYGDHVIRRQVAARGDVRRLAVIYVVISLVLDIIALFTFFQDEGLHMSLLCLPPTVVQHKPMNLLMLLWITVCLDFVVKFGSMLCKCFILLLPESFSAYKRRGRYYHWIEESSQLYRYFLPVCPWICYLFLTETGSSVVQGLSLLLIGIYLFFKFRMFGPNFKSWMKASQSLLRPASYGRRPNVKDLGDGVCSICYSSFREPIELHCKHIFCDDCVSTWFDKEKTCPMCRAEVVTDENRWRDGSTSCLVQLF